MNRSRQSIKNSAISVTSYILKLVLNFAMRTVFIHTLGVEYLGLNSLFANILTLLSLAELGFGVAIVYAMYKPMAENDTEKIKSLLNYYKKVYFSIGGIIIAIGLCLIPALKYLIAGTPNVAVDIRIVYAVFVLNTGLSYFFAHRKTLIFASQRNDIEVLINTGVTLLLYAIQIAVLYLTKNYYVYIVVMPACTILELIMVWTVSRKMFPEIRGKTEKLPTEERKSISKNVLAMSMHRIGGVVLSGTDSIVISSIIGLALLGTYSNYLLIVSSLLSILNLVANAFRSGVGNSVTVESVEYNKQSFGKINLIMQCGTGLFAVCFFVLMQPFIKIWLGSGYQMSFYIVLLFSVYLYLMGNRNAVQAFKDANGLFWQNRYAPIVECLLNLGISIGCVYWFGIEGVLVGTVLSLIVVPFWVEPYILYKYYFKTGLKTYWLKYALHTLITVLAAAACFGICYIIPDGEIGFWITKALICLTTTTSIYVLAYFKTAEFRSIWELIRSIFGRFRKRVSKNDEEDKFGTETDNAQSVAVPSIEPPTPEDKLEN